MVAEKFDDGQIFTTLRDRYPDPDKTDKEIRDLIRGARQKGPQPAAGAKAGGTYTPRPRQSNLDVELEVKPFEPIDNAEELPTEYDNVSPLEFMQRLFRPDEHIAIVLPDSDGECSVDNILTVEQFELMYEHFTGDFEKGRGAWFCINPLKDEESRSDKNVADAQRWNRTNNPVVPRTV